MTEERESRRAGARPSAWRRLKRNTLAVAGLALVGVILSVTLAGPILPLPDPTATDLARRLLPPLSEGHLLGTDQLGRDVLSRLVWGTQVSLAVGVFATAIATVLGTAIGIVAAYYGRILDAVLMRGIDVLMAFPYLLLALAIVAALGPGLRNAMIAIAIVNIPFFARSVRGATLSLIEQDYVAAARLAGFGDVRILVSELLPNVLPAIVIMMATTIGWMILETAGLSFLGLGAQPPRADLGSMLGDGRGLLTTAPHVSLIPGLAIFLLVVGVNLAADGVRDAWDPRLGAEPARYAHATPTRPEQAPTVPTEREALLAVENLSTYFVVGREVHRAVHGVSFTVQPGEAVGLVGESGSGKTVTALSILGLVPPPAGRVFAGNVRLRGEDLVAASPDRLRQVRGDRIAYIPQDPMAALNPVLRVGEQIEEVMLAHGTASRSEARERAAHLLERVQLPNPRASLARYPHELSGGMRQRVLIAAALANDPDLIIADEPTTALDVTIQSAILELLADLQREQQAALLFITHDLGIVSRVCERVLVMYAGRIVEAADVGTIFGAPRHPYTRRLLAAVPILGRPEKSMRPIPGLPPPAHDLPPACAFAPRCEFALPACSEPPITLDEIEPRHWARCIRATEPIVQGSVL